MTFRYLPGKAIRVIAYRRHDSGSWWNEDTGERVDSDMLAAHLETRWTEQRQLVPFDWWGVNLIYMEAAL